MLIKNMGAICVLLRIGFRKMMTKCIKIIIIYNFIDSVQKSSICLTSNYSSNMATSIASEVHPISILFMLIHHVLLFDFVMLLLLLLLLL